MHNRKEGALALLAAHGGGLLITAQQWLGASEHADVPRVGYMGVAMGFFGLGALSAYAALRTSGDKAQESNVGQFVFSWSERLSLLLIVGLIAQIAIQGAITQRETKYSPWDDAPSKSAPVESVPAR